MQQALGEGQHVAAIEQRARAAAIDAAIAEAENWQPVVMDSPGGEAIEMVARVPMVPGVWASYRFDDMKAASRWLSSRCVNKALDAYLEEKAKP